ncbi:hypothetical protein K502DRAFT_346030 [Neoconidiobolus thromboides FSU 785]|nr:hypothetical protein K502DRAFT_346030 [Neoconidiobolus thromboides FSU 785]
MLKQTQNKRSNVQVLRVSHPLDSRGYLVNLKVRSDIDRKRARLEALEALAVKYTMLFKKIQLVNPSQSYPFYAYLKYICSYIRILNSQHEKSILDHCVEQQLHCFESEIINSLKKVVIFYDNNDIVVEKKPPQALGPDIQSYGIFLKNGLKLYIQTFDMYNLLLTKQQLFQIITKKNHNSLSYAFIAFLARFTAPKDNANYHLLYKNSVRNARKELIVAYNTPTYEDVIALIMLSHISLTTYSSQLAIVYFSSAIRMAQVLGYDQGNKRLDIKNGTISKEVKEKLWAVLSFYYMIFSTISTNLPQLSHSAHFSNIKFYSKNLVATKNKENLANYPFYKWQEKLFIGEYNKELIEVFSKITSHIQTVKHSTMSNNDLATITLEQLRLPPSQFYVILTSMLNLEKKYQLNLHFETELLKVNINNSTKTLDLTIINEPDIGINVHTQMLLQLVLIFLYYPFVLVYPKPVIFSKEEINLLFCSANLVTFYYLSTFKLFYAPSKNTCTMELVLPKTKKEESHFQLPFYFHSIFIIYVYFTIIDLSESGFYEIDANIIIQSQQHSLFLLIMLKSIAESSGKNRMDASEALTQLSNVISRFQLPKVFEDKLGYYGIVF